MNQTTMGFARLHKKTCKEVFLEEMEQVVPWTELLALIAPHAHGGGARQEQGRTPTVCGGNHAVFHGNLWIARRTLLQNRSNE